jgi:very-short-patch-repair endonuclease
MDFLDWLRAMDGVCTAAAARARLPARELRRLRDRGTLWVPLRGWLALADVRNEVTRALERGGVVTCASAFRWHGLWTPHGDERLHLRIHRETHSDRVDANADIDGICVHRLDRRLPERRPWDGVDTILTALASAFGCISATDLLGAADSALQQGKLQITDLHELARQLPGGRGRLLELATDLSGSGTESTFAAMLRRARIRFVQQPELLPGELVDFLIGCSLVIEIDSVEWHGGPAQMAKDRQRDARLTALGYRVIRFTYEQILFSPELVLATVLDLVRRDVHERPLFRAAS